MNTRKRTRRHATSALESTPDALFQALQAGALAFLPLADMANVLNSCRVLRFDAELPLLGLAHTDVGSHLLRGCVRDWMSERPSFFTMPGLLQQQQQATCDDHSSTLAEREHNPAATDMQRFVEAWETTLDARRGQHTALLSTLAMVQKRLLPLCFKDHELNRYGDICTARPVVLPLPLALPQREIGYEFTRKDIQVALHTVHHGLGDLFVATPQEYNHVSDFGAHWESVDLSVAATGSSSRSSYGSSSISSSRRAATKATCALCDTAKQAIKEYRKDAKAALKRFNDVLKTKKLEWKADGCDADEIHQRRSELKNEFFPEDAYPDINYAEGGGGDQDDAILADICESGKFPLNPFAAMRVGFDRFEDDVFNALRGECGALCSALFQPLKRVLAEQCGALVGRRVFQTWMGNADGDGDGSVSGELVAGVTRTGFLVGVFMVTQRVE